MQNDLVVDIDLDFFMWPVPLPEYEDVVDTSARFRGQVDSTAHSAQVSTYMEHNLGLQIGNAHEVLGAQVEHHDQAFLKWKQWIEEGKLRVPFSVIHVDAHADLGAPGDYGVYGLLRDLPSLSPETRANFPTGYRDDACSITEANYLVFAIACGWIKELTNVYPDNPMRPGTPWDTRDLHERLFRHYDAASGIIQLSHQPRGAGYLEYDGWPGSKEPEVFFQSTVGSQFVCAQKATHITVARSPQYTVPCMDSLLDVIARYYSA